MTYLLIDNHDSYSYILEHLVASACGAPPLTITNDAFASWDELVRALPPFSAIVISPGPGSAHKPADFGVCAEALTSGLPVLGVCLGQPRHRHTSWRPAVMRPAGSLEGAAPG